MTTIAHLSRTLQTTFTTLAEAADAELHYTKRPDLAKFSASTLVQTLVLGWLAHPDASVEQLARTAARVSVDVSAQAIDQRFTFATAALLRAVLVASVEQLVASDPVAVPILQRFSEVRVQDSTTIVLPDELAEYGRGCGGSSPTNTSAALKCGLQLDLLHGSITALDLADGRTSDHRLPLQQLILPKGSLRLADLGFYDLGVCAALDAHGVFWLSKVDPTARVCDSSGREQPLLRLVRSLGDTPQWEGEVWLGVGRRVRARLLVQRVPQEVADQRRRRLWDEAKRKGRTPSSAALALASWTVRMTNAPAELLSLSEALVVAKVRWQIELVFKLWKSHGKVDEWRTKKAARVLCEVYGKLLAMLVQHWLLLTSCWAYPERSLVKAAQAVREHAPQLASARARLQQLEEALETLQNVLKRTVRLNPRRKRPNTYQLLLALTAGLQDA